MRREYTVREQKRKKILVITIVLTLLVIWGQSCISRNYSEATSDFFVNFIMPLEEIRPDPYAEIPTDEYNFLNHLVRKSAHVVEYAVLGLQMMWLTMLCGEAGSLTRFQIINCLFAGMLTGLVDETIQIFSARGTQVKDIWFDMLGIILGMILVWIASERKKQDNSAYEKNTDNRC